MCDDAGIIIHYLLLFILFIIIVVSQYIVHYGYISRCKFCPSRHYILLQNISSFRNSINI